VSLPLYRRLDIPIFLGANVAIDIEPLLVITQSLNYPLHGYCHTLLIGGFVGLLFGMAAYPFRHLIGKVMTLIRLPYSPTFAKMALSGVLGAWLHVLFDAPIYTDIMPFYPSQANPLYGCLSIDTVYSICAACFLPALIIYIFVAFVGKRRNVEV
jgi:membrane-bound metal-dependent hydrolase YbcI (DUF457 family)